jgi:energy-coupling factor transporter ATP-binding protein EcfA2
MTRWNLTNVFFFGVSGQRREIPLKPSEVNIITGASGTGKSTLIKAIDYCLGSKSCELPAHVRRRSVAVGVKWQRGDTEMIVGRIIPPVGQGTSTRMFAAVGNKLSIPASLEEFDGAVTLSSAKALLERVFGIGDLGERREPGEYERGRATVRHVTPYLFVTKEVIDSETVLLHGLEQPEEAPDLVASMPYFLRAIDETSAIDEHTLRRLQRELEREESKQRSKKVADSAKRQRAFSLLAEANRIGISSAPSEDASENELLSKLASIQTTDLEATAYPSESELGELHNSRRNILSNLEATRRQSRATRTALREASGFDGAVGIQKDKLSLAEHLKLHSVSDTCPVCSSPSDLGKATAQALKTSLAQIREESAAVA